MPAIQYSARSARLYLIGGPLGPPKSSMQTASRSLQAFMQSSLGDRPNRQTDLVATWSVTICGIYVRSTVMRSKTTAEIQAILFFRTRQMRSVHLSHIQGLTYFWLVGRLTSPFSTKIDYIGDKVLDEYQCLTTLDE